MATVFLSYSRRSGPVVGDLIRDIEALGHDIRVDQELSGGQAWWDQILDWIRGCDVFAIALDPETLESTGCKRELRYALDLGAPILPVQISDRISLGLLPPALSQVQIINYVEPDRAAAFRLARAFATLARRGPLPDPLPPPPDIPISYLGGLAERIDSPAELSYQDQTALLIDLKRGLRDPETAKDAQDLCRRFKRRHDLFAAIDREIDHAIAEARIPEPAHRDAPRRAVTDLRDDASNPWNTLRRAVTDLRDDVPPPQEAPKPAGQERPPAHDPAQHLAAAGADRSSATGGRVSSAIIGGVAGTLIGMAATLDGGGILLGLLTGAGGAIAGAIGRSDRRVIAWAAAGAVLGWVALMAVWTEQGPFAAGVVFGAPIGAVLGAMAGVLVRRTRTG